MFHKLKGEKRELKWDDEEKVKTMINQMTMILEVQSDEGGGVEFMEVDVCIFVQNTAGATAKQQQQKKNILKSPSIPCHGIFNISFWIHLHLLLG